MATLRVLVDGLLPETLSGAGQYARELTRHLIATAPRNCDVEGIVPAHDAEEEQRLNARAPGLVRLDTLRLGPRELALAWQAGVRAAFPGMVHAPGLLAPLGKRKRGAEPGQVAVTIHDAAAWTNPNVLAPSDVVWRKAMAKRAQRFADAVVVPTHAAAAQLNEILGFGGRARVIGGAPSTALRLADDADERAARLALPERYVVAVATLEPRKRLRELIAAMALPPVGGLPLLVVGPDEWGGDRVTEVAMAAGLPEGRVRPLGTLDEGDLAVVLDRAALLAYPSVGSGFGMPIVEAFRFGTPVVHSDDPALLEVSGEAGLAVSSELDGLAERLAEAIGSVLTDTALADRLSIEGNDRARAFSWRDTAERVWQLHADL
jgi:glycosyltransferase involved in cell wall biosynthesis